MQLIKQMCVILYLWTLFTLSYTDIYYSDDEFTYADMHGDSEYRTRIYTELCSSFENCFVVDVIRLELDRYIEISQSGTKNATFCFNGYGPWAIFSSAYLDASLYTGKKHLTGEVMSKFSVEVYKGDTAAHARQVSNSLLSFFYRAFYSNEKANVELYFDPYDPNCLLMITGNDIHVNFRGLNIFEFTSNILVLLIGLVALFFVDALSKSPVMHCIIGGLILFSVSVFGPLYLYKLHLDKTHCTYKDYLYRLGIGFMIHLVIIAPVFLVTALWIRLCYLGLVMLFGSCYVYRFHPVSNPRTEDLICGGLRCASILVMFWSFQTGNLLVRIVYILVLVVPFIIYKYFNSDQSGPSKSTSPVPKSKAKKQSAEGIPAKHLRHEDIALQSVANTDTRSTTINSMEEGLQLQPVRRTDIRARINPFTKFFAQFSAETEEILDPEERRARKVHLHQLLNMCVNGTNVNIVMKLHYEVLHRIERGEREMGEYISNLIMDCA